MDFRSRIVRYERVPANLLRAHPRQPWTHPEGQRGDVQENLRRRGQVLPLCVTQDGNGKGYVIVDGHLRADIAGDCEVDVAVTDLSPEEAEAELVALNRTANLVESDDALLASLLQQVNEESGLAGTGYDDGLLAALVAQTQGNGDPLEDPGPGEPPKDPVTKPGDVWLMRSAQGMEHRLVAGDCTDPGVWEALFGDSKADAVVTSPPYSDQRQYTIGEFDWLALMKAATLGMWAIATDDCHLLVNLGLKHADRRVDEYWRPWLDWCAEGGWPLFGWYVWDKGFAKPGNFAGRLGLCHEWLFHFNKATAGGANKWVPTQGRVDGGHGFRQRDGTIRHIRNEDTLGQPFKVPDSVLRFGPEQARSDATRVHPAIFPRELPAFCMRTWTDQGDIVYEPFCGSGTTIIAGEQEGRRVYGVECEPRYVDCAVSRWMRATSQPATLEATGERFPMPEEAVI